MKKSQRKWYGHVMQRREHYVGRRAMEMEREDEDGKAQAKMVERAVWRVISKIIDCRRRKYTTELHGGVDRQTSTPHKSWNTMKRKKKNEDEEEQ